MSVSKRCAEFAVVEGLWSKLDDQQLIRDVVMKGKFISSAIKFIAQRRKISEEDSKSRFLTEVYAFVDSLIKNRQLHRAIHVLRNVQLDELHYLFAAYQVRSLSFVFELCFQQCFHVISR